MLLSRELSRQFSFGVVVRRQILGQREQICGFGPFSVVKLHNSVPFEKVLNITQTNPKTRDDFETNSLSILSKAQIYFSKI